MKSDRMRSAAGLAAALVALAAAPRPGLAEADGLRREPGGVVVEVSREPAGPVDVGQLVRVFVDVGLETGFARPPSWPELRVEGAVAVAPDRFGSNFTRRSGDRVVSGVRKTYLVFPQRAGELEVPPIRGSAGIRSRSGDVTPYAFETDPLRIPVRWPPGADGHPGFVTTPALRVREEYDRDLGSVRLGDAVTRTVTLEAERSLGLVLPDLRFAASPGVKVYPGEPRIEDTVNRGLYVGRRSESVSYVFEGIGRARWPEIRLPWWNPETARFEEAVLPSVQVRVVPTPGQLLGLGLRFGRQNAIVLGLLAFGLFALRRPLVAGWEAVVARVRDARARWRQSEARFFRDFRRACRSGDEDAMVRTYWRWRDRLLGPGRTGSAADGLGGDPEDVDRLRRFAARRYGPGRAQEGGAVSARELLRAVSRMRRARRARRQSSEGALGALNPRSSSAAQRLGASKG